MSRPATIDSQVILAAARETFFTRGVSATTAEIAARAGVSEGTLFKRFGSKVQLFQAAVGELIADETWQGPLQGTPRDAADLEARLVEFVERAAGRFKNLVPLMMMAWSSAREGYLPELFAQGTPPQVTEVQQLAGFLERAMRRGLLARRDALMSAHLLLGSVQHFALMSLMETARTALPLDEADYARRAITTLLDGLRPEATPPPGTSRAPHKAPKEHR